MVEEGGSFHGARLRALRNALNTALRLLSMGEPWIRFNELSRDVQFLYQTEGIKEEYSTTWEMTKARFNSVQDVPVLVFACSPLRSAVGPRIVLGHPESRDQYARRSRVAWSSNYERWSIQKHWTKLCELQIRARVAN